MTGLRSPERPRCDRSRPPFPLPHRFSSQSTILLSSPCRPFSSPPSPPSSSPSSSKPPPLLPLEGIRVLDLSRVLAGPFASQLLADLGATVIKVESPSGDDTRKWGPPYVKNEQGIDTTESSYFVSANRGKKSVVCDLRTEEGKQVVLDLASQSDVFIENFRVGNLAKYGLDFESLSSRFPKLIYCSITGYGQGGPRSSEPGYDFMIQAQGGLMSITGESEPSKVGVASTDITTGLYASNAIMASLISREKTGQGQLIDVSLFDSQLALLSYRAQDYLDSGKVPERLGNSHPQIVPYDSLPTSDGHIIVAVGNDNQFGELCEVLGDPSLCRNPLYSTNPLRVENRIALKKILVDLFSAHTTKEWLAKLRNNGKVPFSPINSIADAIVDPQTVARGSIVSVPHCSNPKNGLRLVGSPIKLSSTPVQYRLGPPMLGEHTEGVLKEELGYSSTQIAAFQRAHQR